MNYHVILQGAIVVRGVDGEEETISKALSLTSRLLNKSASFVEVSIEGEPVIVANTGLVAINFSLKVFNAMSEDHAVKIAKKVVGQNLPSTPLVLKGVNDIE